MLLEFEIKNWKSFKDENYITALSTREEQHGQRRARLEKFSMNILPTLGIFGGNASGKSNFIDAIDFIRNLVVNYSSIQSFIPVEKYLLDEKTLAEPASFYLQMLIDENIYHFSLSLDKNKIISEKLEVENSSRKVTLYTRDEEKITLGDKYKADERLSFIAKGTRTNRLFLSNTIDQQAKDFENIYNWFEKLLIFSPEGIFVQKDFNLDEYIDILNNFLPILDTGIEKVKLKKRDLRTIDLPQELKDQVLRDFQPGVSATQVLYYLGRLVFVFEKNNQGEIEASELITKHKTSSGLRDFNLHMESMGTLRAIELIPIFFGLTKNSTVVIIDEIDKSLHTEMTRGLIEYFLDHYEKESRSQLIFTSHDTNLLSQEIFRRDELWIVERNKYNESKIFSIGDFKDVKKNHNLESLYLQGRLGGRPRINI